MTYFSVLVLGNGPVNVPAMMYPFDEKKHKGVMWDAAPVPDE